MKKFIIAASLISAMSLSQAAPLFIDSFESGNLSTTNTAGFQWGGTNKTGVVNGTTTTFGQNLFPSLGGSTINGSHSLRFQYPATNYMSEQRFDLGAAYPEIWISYWIRVPLNFSHPVGSPDNEKFFALWMDGYETSGDGSTFWLSFFGNGGGSSKLGFTYTEGGNTGSLAYQQGKPFIAVPGDRGRWMQIVVHLKASSSRTATDGVIQTWRRWSNETSFTKLQELTNARLATPRSGPQGWKAGYLMGWANAPYTENTEWLLDDFTVSLEPLISGQTTVQAPPAAPILRIQ